MRIIIAQADLPAIKRSLRKAHPTTKASHRMEAASVGLGFQCYAGLLSALKHEPVAVEANDAAFCANLGVPFVHRDHHGDEVVNRSLSRAIGRIELARVLDAHEDLTLRGVDTISLGSTSEMAKPIAERELLFAERRQEAYEDDWAVDQFELAWIYLSRQKRIATLNRRVSTYGLKHRAENLSRSFGLFTHLGNYVADGMLIAAAYALGFKVKPIGYRSYSARLNISMTTVRDSRGGSSESHAARGEVVAAMYGGVSGAGKMAGALAS